MRNVFPDTPSDGRVEARAALVRAHALGLRARTLRAIQAFFPAHKHGDVQAVLDTLVAEGDADSPTAGSYVLTEQGLGKARHAPNPRFMQLPARA